VTAGPGGPAEGRPFGSIGTVMIPGRTIFDYADDLAMQMPASCLRSGRCHECVVEIHKGGESLGPRTEAEAFLRPPYRLACQARVEVGDIAVEFRPLRRRLRILTGSVDSAVEIDPVVVRSNGHVAYDGEPLDIDRGRALGLAIDVGTTTVVIELVDLESGRIEGVAAFENPQAFGGSDVMNRISYDGTAPGELRRSVVRAANHEIRVLLARHGLDRRMIYEAMIVGNSTMRDVFFGLDVQPIGQKPYKSISELEFLAGERAGTALAERAHRLGLWMNPQGRVVSAPLIASHVGADVAADIVAIDMDRATGVSMLVDVGTNTEVVLTDGHRIVAASCPAGPAFEGGLVRYGMPGAEGAIERAQLDGANWVLKTIGNGPAEGVCGSGLIDLLAELRRHERISPKGVFSDRSREVMIEPVRGITMSREDASNLAQAKAANACGQIILLRALGLQPDQVERLYLAGGFATHVDVANAVAIGFLAPVPRRNVVKVGNASIRGARRLLLAKTRRLELTRFVAKIEHVELETTADFFELFVEGCQFKPMEVA
jgi:uncharacterized 2Fe-2S/4Fe-4S cluster protein (DUF4445 family)